MAFHMGAMGTALPSLPRACATSPFKNSSASPAEQGLLLRALGALCTSGLATDVHLVRGRALDPYNELSLREQVVFAGRRKLGKAYQVN